MSQEQVDFVRRAYEDGWYDNEPERLLARMHPDAELVNPAEAVESGTRRGTWTFRDGKIVRFEWGRDLAAALEAADLSG